MHRAPSLFTALFLLSAAPACGFYFGGDDDDPCANVDFGGAQDQAPAAEIGLVNPETGQCEYFGDGTVPPFPCDSQCGPCPGTTEPGVAVPTPTWGFCESFCTGLDEATCLATAGCRGAYVDDGSNGLVYDQCFMTDQTGPIQGDCTGLDAFSCSSHDDCIAVHTNACADNADGLVPTCLGLFASCAAEPNAADPGNCYDAVTCTDAPPQCPANTLPGVKDGCYSGFCIPVAECESAPACSEITGEMACIGRLDCTPLYEGVNCSCDANGCDCVDWLFDGCEDA